MTAKTIYLSAWAALAGAWLTAGCAGTQRPVAGAPVAVVEHPTGIQVMGQGEAEAVPDVAIFNVGVEARAKTVEAARQEAGAAQRAVLEALRAQGVEAPNIKTTQLTVRPDYDHSEQGRTLLGYVVTNRVEVRVEDRAQLQPSIDASLRAGGDRVRLDGLRFELSDPADVERRARSEAMQAAHSKAKQLASLLGVQLGAPLAVEESGSASGPPVAMRMERMESDAETPVNPGTTRVQVQLRVRWEIAR